MNHSSTETRTKRPLATAMIETVGGHCGAHYYDFGICQGLRDAGCSVTLYTCDKTADPHLDGIHFQTTFRNIYGEGSRWMKGLRFLAGAVRTAWSMMRRGERICHYQLYNQIASEAIVIALAKLTGRKLILTVHDVVALEGASNRKRRISAWLYGLADQIIVHNRISRQELIAIGLPDEQICILPHGHYGGTHACLPLQANARRALGVGEADHVILFFGQIKEAKGLDVLIKAMPAIVEQIPHARLLIAGRPIRTEMTQYEELIQQLGIASQCSLHIRFIPDEEVPNYYAAADLVALPYRTIYQSGVLIMAMTYGRPVVVSDIPGMTEMATDRETAYVFRDGSAEHLAATIVDALDHPEQSVEIGKHASAYIHANFSWESIGRSIRSLYDELDHKEAER